MKPLRLNGDYENELFHEKSGSVLINQALEFFIFFLTDRPVFTLKRYDPEYLSYVELVTGLRPQIRNSGTFENWWGPLKNIPEERWWNSKVTSTQLVIDKQWCKETRILNSPEDFPKIDQTFLIKDPYGMSGQKFVVTSQVSEIKKYPVILEPLLKRKYDFSQYVYPDGKIIVYQNEVDGKFQYKGSVLSADHRLEDLSFYSEIPEQQWQLYKEQTQEILNHYSRYPNEVGYSIDSFVYEENDRLHIRALSEINYRRTMGRMAYELIQKYSTTSWNCLLLLKPSADPLWKKFKHREDILVLSPGDTRYEIVLIKSHQARELLSHA